jgi:hypothetical protein
MSGGINTTGPKNGNWKGGRSIASNGYVLVRVGIGHHLADVRGYAYEHRVVAEKKLGRRLKRGEQVHHKNDIKTDNRPSNLEVCASLAHHFVHHRKPDSKQKRMPGEKNVIVLCACGCGGRFYRYDSSGRERKIISGHNRCPSPTKDEILRLLRSGPLHRKALVKSSGRGHHAVVACLSKLRAAGVVVPVKPGVWSLREVP